jgi:hypothetical protein
MKDNRFTKLFDEADVAFDGLYSNGLKVLKGLSKEAINAIIPGTDGLQVYQSLIGAVEKASGENLSQAQLISNIKELGDKAIKIAKKIPYFAALL